MTSRRSAINGRPKRDGSFKDLEILLETLGREQPIIELGKPVPQEKFLPRRRVGKCPAAHNVALLGEGLHQVRRGRGTSSLFEKKAGAGSAKENETGDDNHGEVRGGLRASAALSRTSGGRKARH